MSETPAMHSEPRQRLQHAFQNLSQGRLDDARTGFADLMYDTELGVDAHRGLASVAWRRGHVDSAIQLLNDAIHLDATHADAHADLALLLMMSGRLADSVEQWKKLLELKPDDAGAWHNMAKCLMDAQQLPAAVQAFERALALAQEPGRTYVTYARALEAAADPAGAENIWRRGLEQCPNDQAQYLGLAQLLFQQSRLDESREVYRQGVARLPKSPELRMGFGQLLEDFGDKAGAEGEFRSALALKPGSAMPLEGLLTLLRGEARDDDIALARSIMSDSTRPAPDHANIGFGLGKCLDKRGDREGAFEAWTQANRARQQQVGAYDGARTTAHVDRLIAQFSAEFIAKKAAVGYDDPRPVFIIGMPRSGTSLVEQILAAHPEVHGYGELPTMSRLAKRIAQYTGSIQKWPEAASALSAQSAQAAAQAYLQDLSSRQQTQARRVTDKAPMNFFYVGLIACLFPQAHFIWCRRDPRDVGLSIYGENFGLTEKHATDLAGIGHYYREYARLMRHWQSCLSERIHECTYENLVADIEVESKKLVDFIGLPWNANCLRFFEDDRPVLTPSRWQVRSPIYQGAVGRWEKYAQQLQPLIDALGDEVKL